VRPRGAAHKLKPRRTKVKNRFGEMGITVRVGWLRKIIMRAEIMGSNNNQGEVSKLGVM
jgi:hypothetical protein